MSALPYAGKHKKSVTSVRIAPTHTNVVASASADKTVQVYRLPQNITNHPPKNPPKNAQKNRLKSSKTLTPDVSIYLMYM
jgi:WD40 repeat protein